MTPIREDLWNLPEWIYPLHWALVIICGALVVYGLWRRIRLWRMGQPIYLVDAPVDSLWTHRDPALHQVLAHCELTNQHLFAATQPPRSAPQDRGHRKDIAKVIAEAL